MYYTNKGSTFVEPNKISIFFMIPHKIRNINFVILGLMGAEYQQAWY